MDIVNILTFIIVLLNNVLKKELDIIVKHISTDNKHADIQTKALATSRFEKLWKLLIGVKDLPTQVYINGKNLLVLI